MAERLSQYPILPNFNPALMQAQQHQGQQQQQQQPPQDGPHPPMQNLTDHTRMWQQIQHAQQPYRQGGDINPQSAQMADLLRSHNLARVQGQQQQQLNQQQPFGGPSQQHQPGQPFHDPSSNQPPQSQHPGFMNNVNGGGNPSLAARNANVLQAFQAGNPGPDMSRQLGIMLAQQQQNQHQNNAGGPINFNIRQQQMQPMNQGSSPDTHNLFPPQGMDRRPSPAHPHPLPNNMPPGPSNPMGGQGQPPLPPPQQQPGQGPPQQRRMTMGELNERANTLRANIMQQEVLLSHLNNQQRAAAASGNQTDGIINKMRQLMVDIKGKKEYLHRVSAAMQANMGVMMSGPNAQQPGNNSGGGGGPGPQQPQPPWIPQQSGQSPSFENNSNPNGNTNGIGNSQIRGGGIPNAPPPNVQPSPSHMHAQAQIAQAQANHLMGVGVPPRSGPTPHQQGPGPVPHGTPGPSSSNTPFSTQMSPNMGPQLPFTGSSPPGMGGAGGGSGMGMNVGIPSQLPPPLEKARFENAYKSWVATKNMKHDMRLMNVEGRPIDLYALHMNVMQEGGVSKVQNQELWSVIGARMGFVHFARSDAEPAKSGPGVAQRLAAVYKEYLMPFDLMYITSVNDRRKQMQAAAAAVQAATNASGGGGGGPGPEPGPLHPSLNSNPNSNSNNSNMNPNSGNPNNPNTSNGNPNNPSPASNSNMGMNVNVMPMPPNPRGSMMDPRMMQQVIGFANKNVAELRQQGVSEQIIAFVESNRGQLQRTVMEQGMFRGQFQNQGQNQQQQLGGMRVGGEQGMRGEQGMGPGGGAGPGQGQGPGMFIGSPGQGNAVVPPGNRPPPFIGQGKGMISTQGGPSGGGGGFMDGRGQMMPQANGPTQLARPSQQQMQQLAMFVEKTKANFKQIRLPNMQPHDIPQEQRAEYGTLIDQLHHFAQEIDSRLPMYMFVLKSEDVIKKLIAIILTVAQQRALFANGTMRYLTSLDTLRHMMSQVQNANEAFQTFLQSYLHGRNTQLQHQQLLPPQGHMTTDMTRPPIPQPPPQIPQQSLHPTARPQPQLPQQQPGLRPPPQLMKMASSSSQNNQPMSMSTPTPPPSHPTPVANAPTPNPHPASSPQAPKSPKAKAKAKAVPKRRVSVAATKNAHNAAANANNAASNASTNPNTPAPPPPPSEPPTPSGSGSGGNTKRQREEEESKPPIVSMLGESPAASGSSAVANEPSPPKRIKTEWEGPPSDALKKKTEAVENVKTEEDAAVFLEQMTELIKMAAGGEGQESLTSDISETLDMILKGYADGTDGTHGLPPLGMGNDGDAAQTSPANPPVDEFVEFFDFSSFGTLDDDDTGSKALTPELSSSSTNPSPESNASESDAAHHALLSATEPISIKMEDNGVMDLLRLGTLKEIDGGESAYFQPSEWKWDGSMPALEQQWAFSS